MRGDRPNRPHEVGHMQLFWSNNKQTLDIVKKP